MSEIADHHVPWFLWPFYAIWRLVTLLLEVTGRVICAVIGLVLLVVGAVLTVTVVGAPLGIPLAAVGLLLLARAIF